MLYIWLMVEKHINNLYHQQGKGLYDCWIC